MNPRGGLVDAAGNVTSDGVYNYAWDAENRIKQHGDAVATYDGWVVKDTLVGECRFVSL